MRRAVFRRSATGMSLFPFLAVLICTMGALIVLLVMVLQQARVQASSAPPASAPSAEQTAEERKLRESKEDLDWRREMLMKQRNDQTNELSNTRKELSHLEDHIRRLQEQAKQIDDQVAELEKLGESKTQDQAGLQRALARLLAQIDAAKIQLEEAKKKAKSKPGSFAIIPYQGPNGTKRRPIYIECAEEGITIYPENIMLQDADFQGPLGPGNPLDAALRTIREYIAKTGDPKKDGEPYPLLLVPPNGTRAYSAARSAMKSWDDEFGYELIDGEMVLKFPPSDPVLEELLLRTLRDARSRQMALAAAMPTRYKNEESQSLVSSPRGGFASAGGADGEGTSMQGGRGPGGPGGRGSFGPGGNGYGASGGGYGAPSSGGYGGSRYAQGGTGRGGSATGGFGTVTHTSGSQTPGTQADGGLGDGSGQSGGPGGTGQGVAGQPGSGQGGSGQGNPGQGGSGFGGGKGNFSGAGGNAGSNVGGAGNSTGGGGTGPGGQGGTNNQGSGGNGGTGSQGSPGMGNSNSGSVDPNQSAGAASGMGGAAGQSAQQANSGANSLAVNGQSGPGSQNGTQSSGGQNGQNSSSGGSSSSSSNGSSGGSAASGSSSPSSSSSGGASASAMESMAKHKGNDWALKNKNSYSTGVTRPIRIQCFTDRLVILSEKGETQRPHVIKLREGYVRGSAEEFVAGIWKHMEPWGLAVQGGYWKPVLRVEVGPGADKQYAQLEAVLRDSGLDVVRK